MEMAQHSGPEGESLLRPERHPVMVQGKPGRWESEEGDRLLRNEPVKLTPAWEGANLPNDTLNLKGVGMDLAPPKDKYRIIYFTLMLHGLGTLTAWNMFITSKRYFTEYKLSGAPTLAANFLPYVGWAAQLPNFLFSWFNCFFTIGGDLTTRIIWSLMIEVLIFVVTIGLAMVDSTDWPVAFFWITMVSVFLMSVFNAIFQNSVYGVAGRLPPSYTGAVVLGSNITGILVTLLDWLAETVGKSQRTAAIYFFIGGMFVLLICFDTYFALPLNRFYRYHDTIEQRTRNAAGPETNDNKNTKVPYGLILKQTWVQLYNIFSVFFVTLTIFPSVHTGIVPVTEGFLGSNFVRFTCFFTFNVTAALGNITANMWQFPSRRWLALFTTLRYLFIPFFLLCNYKVEGRTLPVLINNDYVYWAAAALMGWSSGHGSSLGMMYVGGNVPSEHAMHAGMIGGATLVTGIMSGLIFTYVCPFIVTAQVWSTL